MLLPLPLEKRKKLLLDLNFKIQGVTRSFWKPYYAWMDKLSQGENQGSSSLECLEQTKKPF